MENTFKLLTTLALTNNPDGTMGLVSNPDFKPALFELDGNEDELFYKLNLQLCAVLAQYYSTFDGSIDREYSLKRLKQKYLGNKCECK